MEKVTKPTRYNTVLCPRRYGDHVFTDEALTASAKEMVGRPFSDSEGKQIGTVESTRVTEAGLEATVALDEPLPESDPRFFSMSLSGGTPS